MSKVKKSPAENMFPEEKFSKKIWDFISRGAVLAFSRNATLGTMLVGATVASLATSSPIIGGGAILGLGALGAIEILHWNRRRYFIEKDHGNNMDKAAKFIGDSSIATLSELSTEKRQELLIQTLYSEEEESLHQKIYIASADDNALSRDDITKLESFTDWYLKSPIKDDAYGDWRQNRWNKLLPQIQKIADKHAEIFNYHPAKIETFGGDFNPSTYLMLGQYISRTHIIQLNKGKRSFMSFDNMVSVLLHEATHAYQSDLVKNFRHGKVKKTDPNYKQIKGFALNECLYIRGGADDDSYCAYQNQYVESHAHAAEEFFIDKVCGLELDNIFNKSLKRTNNKPKI